jgi:hypothetical protein
VEHLKAQFRVIPIPLALTASSDPDLPDMTFLQSIVLLRIHDFYSEAW